MAYFGRKPDKPQSLPGSASGEMERRQAARGRAAVERAVRRIQEGRPERSGRVNRNVRSARGQRGGR